nr:hypothetical protein [Candidatus Sigynarchaeota archaeon]
MDANEFVSFSSFNNSRGVEARLASTFIDHFNDLVKFGNQEACKLPGQTNVTREWGTVLGSVVQAIEWEPFPMHP